MALVVKDRVKETTTTTGTGTITLAGAVTGFQSFSVIGNGNTTYYVITDNTDWEVGIGTYTSSGTTLSRDTILESSNSGNAVNWGAGTKDVFVTYPAERSVYTDGAGTAITPATASRLGFANITQGAALSVLGVTGNATADNASIAANTDHQVFRRSGTSVAFGAVDIAQSAAVTGTLPVGNGGTGQTTAQTAINALAGATTSGQYLRGNGSNVVMSAIQAADVPTLNQNTTGSAATLTTGRTIQTNLASTSSATFDGSANITPGVTGTLPVSNGGIGTTTLTANNVILGNGTSAPLFVAPGASGNVLTSNGTTWTSAAAAAGGFDAGTRMIFAQTAAPTGWTKDTTNYNQHALRVVTGTASTGGSVDFTAAFTSQTPTGTVSVSASTGQVAQGGTVTIGGTTQGGTISVSTGQAAGPVSVGPTTLSTPTIPGHTHPYVSAFGGPGASAAVPGVNGPATVASGPTGGGGAHTHPGTGGQHAHPASGTFTGQPHTHTSPFSGAQHAHPVSAPATFSGSAINLAVRYLDVITATKN